MSSTNGSNTLPLFNNNKSLYGTRTQINQFSKKISIIEDKTTLEPARQAPLSTVTNSQWNYHRAASLNIPTSSEYSISQIQKQIQIQKQALESIELDQMHGNVFQRLDLWKTSMDNRVHSMKSRVLAENNQIYDQLSTLQDFMKRLLEEKIIQQLLVMRSNPQMINSEELDQIEQSLEEIKGRVELMTKYDLQLDSSHVELTGDLQLNKTTDFSKHQPLLQPPPSPPPQFQSSFSVPHHDHAPPPPPPLLPPSASDTADHKPTAPVWTDATRQGLNKQSHYLPFRLLIPNYVREQLIENFDIEQFDTELQLSCESSMECILTIINQNDLEASIDILMDLMNAFKCSSNRYELRLLFQKKFLPILTGKRTERLDRLRDKYQLDMVKIFPQTCPQSDERVLLLRGQHNEHIIFCLREIIQNVLEQAHFTDDEDDQSHVMYDPSVNYEESAAHEYGGYKSNDVCEITSKKDIEASSEDLTETKQRSTVSIHSSSSSSLTKNRHNSEENPLNYDDTESDYDDDDEDGLKQTKLSDDTKIYSKELNYVKGRQVGLLIGPFGQHITQIREQTGAKIHLTNDDNEPSVIRGTKTQINQAVRLIKQCLQTQKPIPRTAYKGGRRR